MTKRLLFFSLCCVGMFFAGALVVTAQSGAGEKLEIFPLTARIYLSIPLAVTDEPVATPELNYFDTTNMPTLTWNRLSWATSYDIEIDDDPAFNSPDYSYSTTTPEELESRSHTVTVELGEGEWYWRVRGVSGDGVGSYSRRERFEVDFVP